MLLASQTTTTSGSRALPLPASRRRPAVAVVAAPPQRRRGGGEARVARAAAAADAAAAAPTAEAAAAAAEAEAATTATATTSPPPPSTAADAKRALLRWVAGTRRGAGAGAAVRGAVEEAQVAVEGFAPAELDYGRLAGKWRLLWTTASDVTPIVALDEPLLPPLPWPLDGLLPTVVVGDVFQRFTAPSASSPPLSSDDEEAVGAASGSSNFAPQRGVVENIIELGVPPLTEPRRGVTFTVGASYEVRSPHRIALTFEQAEVGRLRISPALEALLAPAMLPRGWLQQRLLLALREWRAVFPFRSAANFAPLQGGAVGASYQLTYCDEDVLIGRAGGTGGSFVFERVADDDDE